MVVELVQGIAIACALTQTPPSVSNPREWFESAKAWLIANGDEVQKRDEPLVGLEPALLALAFASAHEIKSLHDCQEALERDAEHVVSVPARALAMLALALDPPAEPAQWKRRGAAIDLLLNDLLGAQDLREWEVRRGFLGHRMPARDKNRTYSGFGLNLAPKRQKDYDGRANLLSSALAAMAIRSAERLGFKFAHPAGDGAPAAARAETWPALAQFVLLNAGETGEPPAWPGGTAASPTAASLGALALSLARCAIVPLTAGDERLLAVHAQLRTAFDLLMASSERLDGAPKPVGQPLEMADLLRAAVRARLAWHCGGRACTLGGVALERFRAGDLGFDAAFELEGLGLPDEVVHHYESAGPRRLIANALVVLALSGALESFDTFTDHATLRETKPESVARLPAALVGDLFACDGMASIGALATDLEDGIAWPGEVVRTTFVGRAGWDFGFGAAPDVARRRRSTLRLRRWIFEEMVTDVAELRRSRRLVRGVHCLLGDETAEEIDGLVKLQRAERREVEPSQWEELLRARETETRRAAARFIFLLGVDVTGFDPSDDPATTGPVAAAIAERVARR